jgi:hypothetical protein
LKRLKKDEKVLKPHFKGAVYRDGSDMEWCHSIGLYLRERR